MNEISNNVPEDGETANGPALTGQIKDPNGPDQQRLVNAAGPIGLFSSGSISSEPGIPMQPRPVEVDACCDGEIDCGDDCGCECEAPATQQYLKSGWDFRDFSIKHLNAGYIVTIGCHKIAIETKEKLAKIVSNYILDPNKTEEAFHKEKTVDSML